MFQSRLNIHRLTKKPMSVQVQTKPHAVQVIRKVMQVRKQVISTFHIYHKLCCIVQEHLLANLQHKMTNLFRLNRWTVSWHSWRNINQSLTLLQACSNAHHWYWYQLMNFDIIGEFRLKIIKRKKLTKEANRILS